MILEAIFAWFRRQQVPIRDDELGALDRDGARALNFMVSRGMRRMRGRFYSMLFTLLFLAFGSVVLHWSGAGLLTFVVYGAALTVVIDVLRHVLAGRWLFYSHSRAYRAEEVLITGRSVESGSGTRPRPGARPQIVFILAIAGAGTLIGLPLFAIALNKLGWVNRDALFGNYFLPLSMLVVSGWRLVRALHGIRFAMQSTVGSRDLFLDSDDALDIYALTLVLTLVLGAFGPGALTGVALLVVAIRLAWLGREWWQRRQGIALLQKRVYRNHPHAPGTHSDLGHDVDIDDWR